MNLHSDYPYWMIAEGLRQSFPVLNESLNADVLVIGGGITGALVSDALHKAGLDVVVVDKRHVAHGSTSASTAMLQYELDTPLCELASKIGDQAALRVYQLCFEALSHIRKLCKSLPANAEFNSRPSLLYASHKKHVKEVLEPEWRIRKAQGFKVDLLSERDVIDKFGFAAPAALLTSDAADVNPYLMTSFLFAKLARGGVRVFELSEIDSLQPAAGMVTAFTSRGWKIKAPYVVVASGYESQDFLQHQHGSLVSTYAIISKPLPRGKVWHKNALIWETKTPYHYFRTTADGRIIVGGRDEPFQSAGKRDKLISRKARELHQKFASLFPAIPFETDFSWAGTFGETRDGLPYIGACEHKRVLYALGYGGNGIIFSVIAARILTDLILQKKNPDAKIFAFDR